MPFKHARGAELRREVVAAWSSALLIVPQAVALATVAGLPPEAGLYTSIFPAFITSLLGRQPLLLSGPNTAVCVMIAAALTPLAAPMSPDYVNLALVLALLVGTAQLLIACARLGSLILLVPKSIVHGITIGVGLVIAIGQAAPALGVLAVPDESAWLSIWRLPAVLDRTNAAAATVSGIALTTAVFAKRRRRMLRVSPVFAALIVGIAAAWVLEALFGATTTNLDRVGTMTLTLLPLTLPRIDPGNLYVLRGLVVAAAGIAFVGALQSCLILRSGLAGDDAALRPDHEIAVQGIANMVASLTSGFAGSGSFNRSFAHAQAGARTRWSGALSALLVLAVSLCAAPLLRPIPVAALAGTLVFVGWELVANGLRQARAAGRAPTAVAAAMALAIVLTGLGDALVGFVVVYGAAKAWRAARKRAPVR